MMLIVLHQEPGSGFLNRFHPMDVQDEAVGYREQRLQVSFLHTDVFQSMPPHHFETIPLSEGVPPQVSQPYLSSRSTISSWKCMHRRSISSLLHQSSSLFLLNKA